MSKYMVSYVTLDLNRDNGKARKSGYKVNLAVVSGQNTPQ